MAQIHGIEGLSREQIQLQLNSGARFVCFHYCISILIMTFRRGSDIYFIGSEQSAVAKGLPYTLLSLVAGWWGIPWGPIYTIGSVVKNFGGGVDLTQDVRASLGV